MIHYVKVGIFKVNSNGQKIDINTAKISDMLNIQHESLVIPNANIPNSAGYPTVQDYLSLEANSGYQLLHIDQNIIITIIPQVPSFTTSGNISAQTSATGANFVAFGSQLCKKLTISNQTGTTIEVRQNGTGVAFQIPTGNFYIFTGITNANQLSIRRSDSSNTQVTVTARWESF